MGRSHHARVVGGGRDVGAVQHATVQVQHGEGPGAERWREDESARALDVVRAARDARDADEPAVEGVDADAPAVAAGDVGAARAEGDVLWRVTWRARSPTGTRCTTRARRRSIVATSPAPESVTNA